MSTIYHNELQIRDEWRDSFLVLASILIVLQTFRLAYHFQRFISALMYEIKEFVGTQLNIETEESDPDKSDITTEIMGFFHE